MEKVSLSITLLAVILGTGLIFAGILLHSAIYCCFGFVLPIVLGTASIILFKDI